MSADKEDKISLSYPWIMHDEGIYKMWYGSTIKWKASNGEMVHVIKYAISRDGVNWSRKGLAIPLKLVLHELSRPTVLKNHNV